MFKFNNYLMNCSFKTYQFTYLKSQLQGDIEC